MTFEIIPILAKMLELYQKPANFNRFKEYIALLIGDSDHDLQTPIGAFNPMAKDHIIGKLEELMALNAEKIAEEALFEINQKFSKYPLKERYKVFLNLSDDLKGGWTNHYTSDYSSKFQINALIRRKFCTPIFWTSEDYSDTLIKERVADYVLRTVYWTEKPKPHTLEAHIEQERFVAKNLPHKSLPADFDFNTAEQFFLANKDSSNYNLIFNFFYGDAASHSLGFTTFGVNDKMTGFKYAKLSS